jgi:hypothetical protein
VVFIGANSSLRTALFSSINPAIINPTYTNFNAQSDTISGFQCGIDSIAERGEQYIRWHRLALYAANGTVCLTDNRLLEQYGFVDGKHYFYFSDAKNLKETLNKVYNNKALRLSVAREMWNKLLLEYKMSELIAQNI